MHLMEAQADHTFQLIQKESKKALLKLVRRDQVIIDWLWLEQRMVLININMEMEDAQKMGGNVMSVGLMAPLKDFQPA